MFRYVAVAWDASDHYQGVTAQCVARQLRAVLRELQLAFSADNLLVFCAGSSADSNHAYLLANEGGVVLGRLFDREIGDDTVPKAVILDGPATSEVLRTGGRHLIERHWGRYVAFLRDKSTQGISVLRDPTGVLPCFLTTYSDVKIFFSSMEDCAALALKRFSVNWNVVEAFLVNPMMQIRDTGLKEVSEILPGERIEIRAGARPKFTYCWNPVSIAQSAPLEDMDAAVDAARRTIQACVTAWASCHHRIIHRLSGGLDSSIVLACLRRSPARPMVTCLNFFDLSVDGDERAYARVAAEDAGCELIEHLADPSAVRLERIMEIARCARPYCSFSYVLHTPVEDQVADSKGASAVFGGGGGDNLFYVGAMRHAAADYVHQHLIGRDLLRIALQTAHMGGRSIWGVMREAIRDGLLRRQLLDPSLDTSEPPDLVNPAVVEAVKADERLIGSVQKGGHRLAPGKLPQALGMTVPYALYSPLGPDGPEHVEPLVSQPLMELFLRIPTYVLMAGGEDRAVARRAFAHDLPPEIISRNSKGATNELLVKVLRNNEKFIRELLLDGWLVKERLLDRRKLERFFSLEYSALTPGAMSVVDDYVSLEAWLKGWLETSREAAVPSASA